MRLTNSKTIKKCWNVTITNIDLTEYKNQDYATLQEVAEDLNLTYAQVADIKGGRVKRRLYGPNIVITRCRQTQKNYYDTKRNEKMELYKT
tara:strand:+ start:14772 stop:15044 length:273 start_codon:yes stop_codon:yes gene_type:complete